MKSEKGTALRGMLIIVLGISAIMGYALLVSRNARQAIVEKAKQEAAEHESEIITVESQMEELNKEWEALEKNVKDPEKLESVRQLRQTVTDTTDRLMWHERLTLSSATAGQKMVAFFFLAVALGSLLLSIRRLTKAGSRW